MARDTKLNIGLLMFCFVVMVAFGILFLWREIRNERMVSALLAENQRLENRLDEWHQQELLSTHLWEDAYNEAKKGLKNGDIETNIADFPFFRYHKNNIYSLVDKNGIVVKDNLHYVQCYIQDNEWYAFVSAERGLMWKPVIVNRMLVK